MHLYKVTFTFDSSYRPTTETFVTISLTVKSYDQFSALYDAWQKLTGLSLPEPVEFNAQRIDKQ